MEMWHWEPEALGHPVTSSASVSVTVTVKGGMWDVGEHVWVTRVDTCVESCVSQMSMSVRCEFCVKMYVM